MCYSSRMRWIVECVWLNYFDDWVRRNYYLLHNFVCRLVRTWCRLPEPFSILISFPSLCTFIPFRSISSNCPNKIEALISDYFHKPYNFALSCTKFGVPIVTLLEAPPPPPPPLLLLLQCCRRRVGYDDDEALMPSLSVLDFDSLPIYLPTTTAAAYP